MISTHLNAQMRMEIVVKSDVIYVHLYTLYIFAQLEPRFFSDLGRSSPRPVEDLDLDVTSDKDLGRILRWLLILSDDTLQISHLVVSSATRSATWSATRSATRLATRSATRSVTWSSAACRPPPEEAADDTPKEDQYEFKKCGNA